MNHEENAKAFRAQRSKILQGALKTLPDRKTPYVIGDIEPYISPMTEKPITSRKAHKEDLARHGCRVYEGREQEQREADKWQAEQDAKLEASLDKCVNETYYGLRDGTVSAEKDEKITWTFGE